MQVIWTPCCVSSCTSWAGPAMHGTGTAELQDLPMEPGLVSESQCHRTSTKGLT